MMGTMQAFKGFDVNNPQHLMWLKRKLHNRDRYERRLAKHRQTSRARPRHLTSRKPERSFWWERKVVVGREGVLGRPILLTRAEMWRMLSPERETELRSHGYKGPPA